MALLFRTLLTARAEKHANNTAASGAPVTIRNHQPIGGGDDLLMPELSTIETRWQVAEDKGEHYEENGFERLQGDSVNSAFGKIRCSRANKTNKKFE